MSDEEIPLDADRAGRVHFTDPRVRQLAQARWRLDTGGSRTQWLMLGKDNPRALIGQARDWLRAAVATRLLPLIDEQDEAACTVCGCTEDNACEGSCAWVTGGSLEVDLCTACAFAIARDAVAGGLYTPTAAAPNPAADTDSTAPAAHDTGCDYCLCCQADRCNRFPDSGCPTNSLGESICPCTEAS